MKAGGEESVEGRLDYFQPTTSNFNNKALTNLLVFQVFIRGRFIYHC